jgi:hypothetical protein
MTGMGVVFSGQPPLALALWYCPNHIVLTMKLPSVPA